MAFELTNDCLRQAIEKKGWGTPESGKLHVFGLRLCVPWSGAPNYVTLVNKQFNAYTSTIGLFGAGFQLWLGSVDPGDDYTFDPSNPAGCAHLCDGKWLYQKGSHKGHPALVQAGPVTIWRDSDEDFYQDPSEAEQPGQWIGINIHAGGTSDEINDWSAGCQIIKGGWDGDPWTTFYERVEAAGQDTYNYYLLPASDVAPD